MGLLFWLLSVKPVYGAGGGQTAITLPEPSLKGTVTVEEALEARRTHRSFMSRPVPLGQFSQILWAAYGVTAQVSGHHLKTTPSAGALYPIEIYAVVGEGGVESLPPAVYRYCPEKHSIGRIREGDVRSAVAEASFRQMWMAKAPAMVVITGQYGRSTAKYGRRGITYTHIEAGHVGQNIFLQTEALGLKAGIVGAFNNEEIIDVSGIAASHDPLLIMPVGFPR